MQLNTFGRVPALGALALMVVSCSPPGPSSNFNLGPGMTASAPPQQGPQSAPPACITLGGGLAPTTGCGIPSSPPVLVSQSSGTCSPPATSPYPGKSLVWDDEFTYTGKPDPSKWNYDQLGPAPQNNEIEVYTDQLENAQVTNCLLTLTAIASGNQYTSARIGSVQGWTYGRFDIMAKLPCGQGTWPALWMMPKDSAYGGWPASGELDIMELSNTSANSTTVLGTEHTSQSGGGGTSATTEVSTDCSAFHLYSMDWSANKIQILVDNKAYNTYPEGNIDFTDSSVWPFNKAFYFIFNIAVGGTLGGSPDASAYPQTMQIQYVRVYQ